MMMMDEFPLTGIFLAGGSISAELTVIHNANMCCQDNFRKKRQSGKHLAKDTNYLTSMGVQRHKLIMLSFLGTRNKLKLLG